MFFVVFVKGVFDNVRACVRIWLCVCACVCVRKVCNLFKSLSIYLQHLVIQKNSTNTQHISANENIKLLGNLKKNDLSDCFWKRFSLFNNDFSSKKKIWDMTCHMSEHFFITRCKICVWVCPHKHVAAPCVLTSQACWGQRCVKGQVYLFLFLFFAEHISPWLPSRYAKKETKKAVFNGTGCWFWGSGGALDFDQSLCPFSICPFVHLSYTHRKWLGQLGRKAPLRYLVLVFIYFWFLQFSSSWAIFCFCFFHSEQRFAVFGSFSCIFLAGSKVTQ